MTPVLRTIVPSRRSVRSLRVGFVGVTDAAPLVVAEANGYFADHGVEVELHRQLGWATLRDRLIHGELDAGQAPAPMLWDIQLGLTCPARDVLTAQVLSLHRNAITLSRRLWDSGVRDDVALRRLARDRNSCPLTFAVAYPFSSQHLLLREWLLAAGVDPDHDVRLVIVPPAQMFRNLAAGTLDGFCAGEPWNSLAVRHGAGWCRECSALEQAGQVETVLLVTRRFAELRHAEHAAMVAALHEAAIWCDEPQSRGALAGILSDARYLNVRAGVIAPALTGNFDFGTGTFGRVPDCHVFHRGDANVPSARRAEAIQAALIRCGLLPASAPADLPADLFREDLYRDILVAATLDTFGATTSVPAAGAGLLKSGSSPAEGMNASNSSLR